MEAFFETKNLTVGYEHRVVLEQISLSVKKGEIVTLIGPNGAGKSTLLKSLAKQIAPLGGQIYIGEDEMSNLSYQKLSQKMAVVLTEPISPELMEVREVVAMGRYPYTDALGRMSRQDWQMVEEAMELAGITHMAKQEYQTLSDGQKQRVLLARAICQQTEVLVLDEPTSYLDIRYKIQLLNLLRKMAREKKRTILLSLHEIDLAQKISDKILCIKDEKIIGYGTPEEIYTQDKIAELYDLPDRAYNLSFGSVELPKSKEKPTVFVLSNGGSGIPVYRRLQREGVGFYAGILAPNDVDYLVAKNLAWDVAETPAFEEISQKTMETAKEWIDKTNQVIVCDMTVGKGNERILELVAYARRKNKLVETER